MTPAFRVFPPSAPAGEAFHFCTICAPLDSAAVRQRDSGAPNRSSSYADRWAARLMGAQPLEVLTLPRGKASLCAGDDNGPIPTGMRAALRSAQRGEGWVSPNPIVGAALEIPSGTGRRLDAGRPRLRSAGHLRFGGPHAEARLLAGLDVLPPGSVLYLTLEPCCHHGKTSPCVDRVLQLRPSRVVVACLDPNPAVSGKGVALLCAEGVRVDTGVGEIEALSLALPFHLYHTAGRALVRLKVAASLDARLADRRGLSRWISCEEARRHAHRERSRADAVLIGSGTALADDPELTVRHLHGPQPSRIVVDSRLRTAADSRIRRAWMNEVSKSRPTAAKASRIGGAATAPSGRRCGNYRVLETPSGLRYIREARLILATKAGHPDARLEAFRRLGWEIWILPARRTSDGGSVVSLRALTRRAGREGLLAILAEAGPSLAAGLMRENLADELLLYQAPLVLGGPSAWPGSGYAADLRAGRSYARIGETRLGPDLLVRLRRDGLLEGVRRRVHRLG